MVEKKLEEANALKEDIKNIERVLEAHKGRKWIKVVHITKRIGVMCPLYEDMSYSVRFQDELAEWLKQKREQYQKEFDAL